MGLQNNCCKKITMGLKRGLQWDSKGDYKKITKALARRSQGDYNGISK